MGYLYFAYKGIQKRGYFATFEDAQAFVDFMLTYKKQKGWRIGKIE